MPRLQVRAPSARIASQMKTRSQGGPAAAAGSAHSASSAGSSSSSSGNARAMLSEGRQLRSRTVLIATGAGNLKQESARARAARAASARPIRVRRRSRSAASSRASEAETCNNSNAATQRRPAPRLSGKQRAGSVLTRATARANGNARMSLGGGVNLRRRGVSPEGQEHQLPRRASAASSRNLTATRTARNLRNTLVARTKINCQVVGCHIRLQPLAMEKHFLDCRPRFPCPLAPIENCKWVGPCSRTKHHIIKDHRSVDCKTGSNGLISIKDWERPAPLQWLTILTSLGQDFLVIIKKTLNDENYPVFCGLVSMFGEQEDNDRFEFRMVLKTPGPTNRVYSYSSVVGALQNTNSAIHKGDCFSFDSAYAELFSSKDDNLQVGFSISVTKM